MTLEDLRSGEHSRSGEPLFRRRPVHELIQSQTEAVKKEVESIPPNTLLDAIEHDLVEALVERFRLDVPVIRDSAVYIADSAARRVEATGDTARRPVIRVWSHSSTVAGSRSLSGLTLTPTRSYLPGFGSTSGPDSEGDF